MSVHWERPEVTGRRSEPREQPLTDVGRLSAVAKALQLDTFLS